jgi:hypothetical protein
MVVGHWPAAVLLRSDDLVTVLPILQLLPLLRHVSLDYVGRFVPGASGKPLRLPATLERTTGKIVSLSATFVFRTYHVH